MISFKNVLYGVVFGMAIITGVSAEAHQADFTEADSYSNSVMTK